MNKIIFLFFTCFSVVGASVAQQTSLEQLTSYPFPSELTTSKTGDRIAVAINQQGHRNLYVAEGPNFELRKLTQYDEDLGDEITSVQFSADGLRIVFVKGGDHGGPGSSTPRNPASLPIATKVQVWSVAFDGGEPVLLADGDSPQVSPAGNKVAFLRQGQVWVTANDGSSKPEQLFYARGNSGEIQWSPDGNALAFVSSRGTHSIIGVYTDKETPIRWVSPHYSRDGSPRWSPDGQKIAFVRRLASGGAADSILTPVKNPWSIVVSDLESGKTDVVWQSPDTPEGAVPTTHDGTNLHWGGKERVTFLSYHDGWPHLYSVPETGGSPLQLTSGNYMVEHIKLSPDGRYLLASANTGPDGDDIDRRHIIRVPVDKPEVEVLTSGLGIETFPSVTADGRHIAYFSATATRPTVVAVRSWESNGAKRKLIGEHLIPTALKEAALVTPTRVEFKASDGGTVYGQLFTPRGDDGAKKPAIVYIHGGPQRQMLLGWHYGDYYANNYAVNQYLTSQGFVVLSVNYRLGIGYGFDFHKPPYAGRYGASEYLDIKAAGEWLASQPDIDQTRIGVYGGSYGGFLTALAVGKDSDLFAAGVDIHGVHNYVGRVSEFVAEPAPDIKEAIRMAKVSSPISYVDTWRSPVLFIHGDDDANVDFRQTVDLIRRLEQKKVSFEAFMIPDETHHWMRYENLLRVNTATVEFLERHLKN